MNMVSFGTILKNAIKGSDFTQERFADEIGISISALKTYMNGTRIPDIEILDRMCKALNCDYDYLMGKIDKPRKDIAKIGEVTGLSYDAVESLESLNNIIRGSEMEGLVVDSERILKVINFILDDSHMGMQFLLNIGRYLFVDYGSEHHSEVKVIEDFIELVDKKTKRKQGFPVSIIKQSLISGITFQLQEWEKDIRTNKEK